MPILLRARTRGIDMDRGRDSDYQWPRAPTGYIKQFVRFSEKELSDLTFTVVTIHSWNHLSIAGRTPPETYQAAQTHKARKTG
jgi:hypothetical protein